MLKIRPRLKLVVCITTAIPVHTEEETSLATTEITPGTLTIVKKDGKRRRKNGAAASFQPNSVHFDTDLLRRTAAAAAD